MIDESTDISVSCHLVLFASFIEEEFSLCVFFLNYCILKKEKKICMNNILNINMKHEKIKTIF